MSYDFNLDDDGYPTEEFIDFIKKFDAKTMSIFDFIELWRANWWMPDWGFHIKRKYKGIVRILVSTGGWSGNEETISAIKSNFWLRQLLGYYQWNTGGHYKFRIKIDRFDTKSGILK